MEQVNLCKKCNVEKPFSEFYKDRFYKKGIPNRCKDCFKKYSNELFANVKVIELTEKVCACCKEVKEISQFCKNNFRKDKTARICRECYKTEVNNKQRSKETYVCECGTILGCLYRIKKHLTTKNHLKYLEVNKV